MKYKTTFIFYISLVLFVALAGCTPTQSVSNTKTSTQIVKKGNLQIGLYADGRITLPVTNLNFEVSGTVKNILVQTGQTVIAGDLLAELDDTDLQLVVTNAENNLSKAKASYNDAVSQRDYSIKSEGLKLDSLYTIYEQYLESLDDTSYQTAIDNADSNVAKRQKELEEAKKANTVCQTAKDNAENNIPLKQNELEEAQNAYNDAVMGGSAPEVIQEAQEKVDAAEAALGESQTMLENAQQSLAQAQKSVDAAEVALNEAWAVRENAQLNLENAEKKYENDKAKSKADYDLQKLKYDNVKNSSAAVTNAELSVEDTGNKLEEAKNNLSKVKLYAPSSGVVINIAYKAGELASAENTTSANGTTGSSADFMTLCDPTAVYMSAYVTEGDIFGIEVGQTMRITIDSLGLENLLGKVDSISAVPKIDNTGIVTYEVTGKFDNPDEKIMDGMSCFITFVKKEKTDVLLVSNKAVFIEDGKQYVMVQLPDGTSEKRAVVCGLTDGTQSEAVEGLKEGETIVIGGVKK